MLRQLIGSGLSVGLFVGMAVANASESPKPHVDDFALRYYAAHGQKDRVEKEAQRLSSLDPNWRIPADLYSSKTGRADEGPLWDLFTQNRIDDVEAAIAQRRAADPGWTPSDDLQAKIQAKVLRANIMKLAAGRNWHGIVQSFKSIGTDWATNDAEAQWIIAEAYAREDDCGEAYVIYHSIMAGPSSSDERRATIERAIATIPMSMVEKLILLEHVDAAGHGEFEPITLDITRARISAYLHDEPAKTVEGTELAHFEDFVRTDLDPNQAGLLGWYAFKRHDYPRALDWFKTAIAHGGDAMIAHGLAHTLRKLGMKREAEEVAYAWRGPLVNNSILFIDLLEEDFTKERPPYIEPARVQRYAQVTMATESGEGAQALAWYAYNTCQYPLALQWFERSVAWLPKEATVYGYTLALQRVHRTADFRTIVNRYDGLFPKVVALAFDDGLHRPPPSCETTGTPSVQSGTSADAPSNDGKGLDWSGRTMADTLLQKTSVRTSGSDRIVRRAPQMPSPDAAADGSSGVSTLVKRTEFPVAVTPENPLRFSEFRPNATSDNDVTGRGRVDAGPLVARRVPGVGAMPYERYGFTLLPGYDGSKDSSAVTAAEASAPAGTLWALEQSLPKGSSFGRSQEQVADTTTRPVATNIHPVGASASDPRL